MKKTQYIVMAVLIGTGTLSYGLSQTSSTVFYVANKVSAASYSTNTLTQLASKEDLTHDFKPLKLPIQAIAVAPKQIPEKKPKTTKPTENVTKKSKSKSSLAEPPKTKTFGVPFVSQLKDIADPEWKKIGCGIASLAMIVNFHEPESVDVNKLLDEGIKAGAYSEAGWTYAGLISVAIKHGVDGQALDLGGQAIETAFSSFSKAVAKGPVMASVHYKFEPTNPIPHLVVVTGISDGLVYYNDPASPTGNLSISLSTFKAAWKKRYLEFYPLS